MDKLAFIKTEFPRLLRTLSPEQKGKWGKMNAQQMVEHMSDSVHYATGDLGTQLFTPEHNLEKFRAYALSDREMNVNTQNRMLPDEPIAVKNEDIESAIKEYEAEVNDFIDYFAKNKESKLMNPIFGEFTYDNWVHLLYKHAFHHAKQFGLVD